MYQLIGRMMPGPLDEVDWADLSSRWFDTGWCTVAPEALMPFRAEVERQLSRPVGVLTAIGIRPGGHVHPHEDGLTKGWQRVHLVLQTNPWCWSFHHDGWQRLDQGSIYSMNANQIHASINLGETGRWHLIADSKE